MILKVGRLRGIGSCDDNGICTDAAQQWVDNLPTVTNPGGFDWTSIFAPITNAAARVVTAQYGQPNIPPGTVLINGPNGQQYIRYQNGQQVPYVPSSVNVRVPTAGGGGVLWPAVAIGIGVFVLTKVAVAK